jgi:nitrogen fixation NifU-like protein
MFRHILKKNYHKRVLDHFNNPKNIGSLDKSLDNVGTGLVGSPACGDVLKLQIKVENNIITDTKAKVFGCGSAVAATSYGSELIKGMTLNDASNISNRQISKHLVLPPVKNHCSSLCEDAIKDAIKDYKLKQVKKNMHKMFKDL